ncbi:MAG TPA: cysteine hydrolase [Candidatus Acidoferrales bacterium]|nr:cysteine hydrolase [Candidatus Acidoferrales bacterium]
MAVNVNAFDARKTGLLFFDMLNVYYHGAPAEKKEQMRPVVANAQRLLEAARRNALAVFYAKANHRRDGKIRSMVITDTDMRLRPWPGGLCDPQVHAATEGSWEAEIIPELEPRAEDTIIPKYRWSAFHQTYLDLALRARGIDTIILCGGSVDVGVASTAYSARDLDYNLIIVRDACSGSEDTFGVFMERIFPKMARVRTTDQVLQMISGQRA